MAIIGSGFRRQHVGLCLADEFKKRGRGETILMLERGTWWTTHRSPRARTTYDFLVRKQQPVQHWSSQNHFRGAVDLLTRCYRRPGNEDGLYDFTTLGKPGFLGLFGHRLEEPQSASRHRRGELALWQCRFWEHQIRDEADYARHVDYAHYNAVKHGLVRRACDWPHSTFPRFVRLGLYPPTGPVAVSKTPAMNLASLRYEPRAHSAPYGYWCSIWIRSMKVRSRSALTQLLTRATSMPVRGLRNSPPPGWPVE